MKILSICYEFPPLGGGGANAVSGLLKEFVAMGHEVDLVTMGPWGFENREAVDGVNIIRVPCIRLKQSICFTPEMIPYITMSIPIILSMLRGKKYDINHTHFIFPDGIIAYLIKKLTGMPYLITSHGSDVPGYNPNRFRLQHLLLRPLWNKIVSSAETIISPSHFLKLLIESHGTLAKIELIPYGFDFNRFELNRVKKDSILVVTRMFERKGIQYLLEALAHINHSYKVHIVGDGPYLKTLKKIVDEKQLDVHFWGFLENRSKEMQDLYETSRIFVLPSESDNFPVALLEAMASSNAIITTKDTGCAEVVGDTAILVNARDPKSIKQALNKLIHNSVLCAQLGNAARKRIETNFSWKAVSNQYISLFESSKVEVSL
ncbi:MAG: glycosyltransferase family 4 protein [Candidatus Brocadiaceae bacterium]|nr:glycosyltransferase family 4 protein [Candidatus Brocadiaceae bacterium]